MTKKEEKALSTERAEAWKRAILGNLEKIASLKMTKEQQQKIRRMHLEVQDFKFQASKKKEKE